MHARSKLLVFANGHRNMFFGFGDKNSSKTKPGYEPIPDHDDHSSKDIVVPIVVLPIVVSNEHPLPKQLRNDMDRYNHHGNWTLRSILWWLFIFFFVLLIPSIIVVTKRISVTSLFSWNFGRSYDELKNDIVSTTKHHETLPTFLSLVEMSISSSSSSTTTTTTNRIINDKNDYVYVYALDNPYYDFITEHSDYLVDMANTHESLLLTAEHENDQEEAIAQPPGKLPKRIWIRYSIDLPEEKRYDTTTATSFTSDTQASTKKPKQYKATSQKPQHSMLIQWQSIINSNSDIVATTVNPMDDGPTNQHDDTNDLLVLFCNSNDEETHVLEVATVAQVRATHDKAMLEHHPQQPSTSNDNRDVESWYIPHVPSALFRQTECYWVYWYYHDTIDNHHKNDMAIDPTTLDVQQYIPIGISNRYQMSTLQNMLQPTNVHMTLTSQPDEMIIQFTTGGGSRGSESVIGTPIVEYSVMKHQRRLSQPNDYDDHDDDDEVQRSWTDVTTSSRVSGSTDTYSATDMCQEPANITGPGKFMSPGNLHTVVLSNLQSNTMYTYRVGMETGQGVIWNSHSGTFQTAIPPARNDDDVTTTNSFTFLVYGDQGCPASGWEDGHSWMDGMVHREVFLQPSSSTVAPTPVRMIHHVGDLSYAQGAAHIWDAWLDMIQPVSMYVPIMIAVGNHEYDHMSGGIGKDPSKYVTTDSGFMPAWGNFANDSGGECGVPTSKRFAMPTGNTDNEPPELQNNGVYWYWFDYGLVRTIVVSSEHDLSEGSIQHVWLEHILFNTNRTITPWVIVELHRPLYEMEEALFPHPQNIGIAMRYEFEDLLHDYNVDIVFSGHFHTYHRTCDGLYRSRCQNGGPMHITIGTAGAHLNAAMSLYRRPTWTEEIIFQTYGYGRVTVVNRTVIHFEFIKAGNEEHDATAGTVLDEVYITRNENR